MRQMTRRIATIGLAGIVGWLAFLKETPERAIAGEKAKPPAKEEVIVLGPFTLSEVCEKGGNIAKDYAKRGGPTEAETLKALRTCKLYVLDTKRWQNGQWQFVRSEGNPKVVAEGFLHHDLKDEKGKDFTIQLSNFYLHPTLTNHDAAPPYREAFIQVVMRVEGWWGVFPAGGTYYSLARIRYDINGKTNGLVAKLPD